MYDSVVYIAVCCRLHWTRVSGGQVYESITTGLNLSRETFLCSYGLTFVKEGRAGKCVRNTLEKGLPRGRQLGGRVLGGGLWCSLGQPRARKC